LNRSGVDDADDGDDHGHGHGHGQGPNKQRLLTIELLAALRSPRKANDAMCTDDLHNLGQSAFNCKPLISSCDSRGIEYSPAPLRRSAFVTRMGVYVSLRALIDAAQDTERCIPYEQPL
jgi:hypothetical protein